jgi:hypothetical protein
VKLKSFDWQRFEARLERGLLGAGLSLLALVADFVLARRLRR